MFVQQVSTHIADLACAPYAVREDAIAATGSCAYHAQVNRAWAWAQSALRHREPDLDDSGFSGQRLQNDVAAAKGLMSKPNHCKPSLASTRGGPCVSLFANGKIYATMVFSHQNEKVSYAAPMLVAIATIAFCHQNENIVMRPQCLWQSPMSRSGAPLNRKHHQSQNDDGRWQWNC